MFPVNFPKFLNVIFIKVILSKRNTVCLDFRIPRSTK